jgi:hypothetical protein
MARARDPLKGLGLVVVDGVPFLTLRVLLVAVLVGDFSLGLLKQTVYMLAIALVTDSVCRYACASPLYPVGQAGAEVF